MAIAISIAVSGAVPIVAMPRRAMLSVTVVVAIFAAAVPILAPLTCAAFSIPSAPFFVTVFVLVTAIAMARVVARALARALALS